MKKHLEGKVAIVTGSGQGIGKGLAVGLAREGAKIITNNRKPNGLSASTFRKEDMPEEDWKELCKLKGDAETTAALIKEEGGEAIPFYGDCSDWNTAKEMIETAIKEWGRIDIIVNNAAGTGTGSVENMTEENWDHFNAGRTKAAIALMHFAFPYMKKQGFGRIINVASDAWVGLAGNSGYSCSTAGMVGLTYATSKELDQFGITVNCICPQGASPAHAVEYNKLIREISAVGHAPDPKILASVTADHGDPANIAPFITVLCEEDGAYINGSIFSVTSAGKVKMYSYPQCGSMLFNDGNLWNVDVLKEKVKADLTGPDYAAPGKLYGW